MGYRGLFCGLVLLYGVVFAGEIKPPSNTNANATLLTQLERPIALDVLETDLASGLKAIAEHASVKLILEKGDNEEVWLAPVDFKFDAVRPIDLLDALSALYDFQYSVEARGLVVQRKKPEAAPQHVSMRFYDVGDLCRTVQSNGFDCFGPQQDEPFSGDSTSAATVTNIADMIRNRVRPDSWDAALGTSIEERGGKLVIMQQDEVHVEVRALLSAFRATLNRQVSVDCRFLSVRSVDFDRIRAESDARGLSRPALDDLALDALQELIKNGSATSVYAGQGLSHNLQDCWIQNLRQSRTVNDYDVSGNTYDPVVRTRYIGASLLCRPMLSDDGAIISLNLRAMHSALLGSDDLLVSRGGIIEKVDPQDSKFTIRKKKKEEGKKAVEADPAPAPNGAPANGNVKPKAVDVAEDVTEEFEIERNEAPRITTLPSTGPLYCQLLTMGFSKLSQEIQIRSGQTVALSMPQHGANGIETGRELLVLVRADFIRGGREGPQTPKPLPRPSESVANLLTKPVTLKLDKVSVQVALESLAKAGSLPLFMSAQSVPLQKREEIVTIDVKAQPVGEVLLQVLDQANCATLAYNSLLLVTLRENVINRSVVLRIHDVRDMTTSVADYPNSMFNLPREQPGVLDNPYDGGGVATVVGASDLATLLRERVFPRDFSSPATAIEESGGKLVILNTPEVHEKVAVKLHELRQTLCRSVAMTARWAVVDAASLEAALGKNPPAVMDSAQAAKALALIAGNGARDLAAARFVCRHGQRASSAGGTHRDVILDYDYSGSLPDPIKGSYYCGAMADFCVYLTEEIDGVAQIRVDTRLVLSRPDLKRKPWDPLGQNGKPVAGYPVAPGLYEHAANDYSRVLTSMTFPDGGGALFRMTPPEWIEGENPEALRNGKRIMIVIVQGSQQHLAK